MKIEAFTIVRVDELDLESDAVSWILPIGETLLVTELCDRITMEDARTATVKKIEYPETR